MCEDRLTEKLSATQEIGVWSETSLGKSTRPYLKKQKAKRAGGMDQAVERLPA
jgi:hypothetical protein